VLGLVIILWLLSDVGGLSSSSQVVPSCGLVRDHPSLPIRQIVPYIITPTSKQTFTMRRALVTSITPFHDMFGTDSKYIVS